MRRARGEPAEVVSATTMARGYPAELTLVGDEGVGSVRVSWKEAEGPCESYELWVSYSPTSACSLLSLGRNILSLHRIEPVGRHVVRPHVTRNPPCRIGAAG